MKKNFFLTLMLLLVALFSVQPTYAQAPVAKPIEAVKALLNRIGGDGAADKFEIVIDANLAEDGKDVFVITTANDKPCIKGNSQLSVATGINWYLNHVAHINLTWNNLTTDLSDVELPLPVGEDEHVSNVTYRYNFNTCTFSYSMAFWTWERWQKEIDWMALHGINAPLNLVGLDVVTRNFLKELGVSDADIAAYIAGPGFIAWFAMNNLEGWGGTVNATDVTMNGNPEWWYARQEQLCKNMLQRMRELGMQPVIPGFSGQVPNCIVNYATTINNNIGTFNSGDVMDNGTWAGGYTRPDILKPFTDSYKTLAEVYYKHLEAIMGVSEFYSMDPFHEGSSLPTGITADNTWPNIMAELDVYHNAVDDATKESYNVGTDDGQAKWIIQYWQGLPPTDVFGAMSGYSDRFIALDLFADNIYADNAAKWRTNYYQGRPYIYCMLHNFGGRSGMHGRLQTTMDGYFDALDNGNNMQGVGATPEGTETNPILYDMLFELPWMDVNNRPTVDEWLEDYAYARYGIENDKAFSALNLLKNSVWNCERNQQGTSEAIILGRPRWTFGDAERNDGVSLEGRSVSSWSKSSLYWDTQDVRLAADELISISDLITTDDGIANYDYDVIEVVRQSMCDLAYEILPLIKAARNAGNDTEYERLYKLFLQLMLDLDTMLSYDENFTLERWTSLARNIAGEGTKLGYTTTDNDRNWLEWNARTQVTVWSKGNNGLNDYSNRCWAGLIKDFHYPRWKYFFENDGAVKDGNWFTSEYAWTVDYTNYDYSTVEIPNDMTATKKAVETFGNYFGRVKGATKNYLFPMGITTDATDSDVIPEIKRGMTVELPLVIGKNETVTSVQIDLNGDDAMGDGETLEVTDAVYVTIPADATIGKTTATVTFSDATNISFNLAIVEDITENRTVLATTADANMGTVVIEGDDDSDGSITNMEAVKITATANTGYNFKDWTNDAGNVVSNDNPYIYYGKDDATFTANFIQDKWGVVECNGTLSGDIAGYAQFIHNLTFAYYDREPETILNTITAPTQIFNTIPQIINVPRGASFDVYYDDGDGDGLKYCYFRAFIDLNADGDFDDAGELLKEVGTNGAQNSAVCSNTINVLLPYDMPLGITHMRLRFDGAWDNGNNPSGRGAKDVSIRPVYEFVLNITEGSKKAAHIIVESNNNEWGTAEVWTEETPGWSPDTEWDVSTDIYVKLNAEKVYEDVEFLGWYDHYGRLLTTDLFYSMLAKENATYTAKFNRTIEIDDWVFEYRIESRNLILTKLVSSAESDLTIPETVHIANVENTVVGFDTGLFNNCKELLSITLPASIEFLSVFDSDVEPNPFEGCSNLDAIAIDGTCDNYYVDANGDLYNAADQLVCSPAGKEKGAARRELGKLIDDFGNLIEQVATIDPVGLVTELELTTDEDKDYYVWTNADHNDYNQTSDGGGIDALIDGQNNTFLHTNWNNNVTAITEAHFIEVNLGDNNAISSFKFDYMTRHNGETNWIKTLKIYGSNDKINYEHIATVTDLPSGAGKSYESKVINATKKYSTLRFTITETNTNATANGLVFSHMAEFNLYNVTSLADVNTVYESTGVTDSEIAGYYDALANAVLVYNNGTTAAEMEEQYNNLNSLYTTLKDKTKGVYNGVYQINYLGNSGTPVFIQYNTVGDNSGNVGYKLIGTGYYTTDAAADKLFTITPSGNGYTLSAQGKYLKSLNVSYWNHALFSDDESQAGVYIFEETETDIYKLKVESGNLSYLNNYDNLVFGSNNSATATFSFTEVTEYTLTVPESGYTTLCLPFNVVLPEGVTAYDVVAKNVYEYIGSNVYELSLVAKAGKTLAKGTPVIIKAETGDYSLAITMDSDGAKSSTEGSVLRSGLVKTTIGTAENNYAFADGTFNLVTANTDVAANQCWMVLDEQITASIKDKENIALPFEVTTDEEHPVLYNIISGRYEGNDANNDHLVLKYDKTDGKVALTTLGENNIYQAWYFMATETGIEMLPFNANGAKLGATDVTDGADKVSTSENNTYYEWFIVESPTTDWYNIYTVVDESKYYFSNYGGIGNKMGFWDGTTGDGADENSTKSDGGSQFQFIEAEFGNDNARYYQLEDLLSTMDITKQAMSGDAPGCRDGGDAHFDAYTAAAGYINEGNTADADDCYDAYTTLRATRAALGEMKMPEPGEVYRIKNFIALGITGQKYHYIANNNAAISFPTEADNSTTLWVCVAGENGTYKFVSAMGTATLGWQKAAGKDDIQEFAIKTGVERGAVALNNSGVNLSLRNEAHANGLGFDQASNNVTAQVVDWSTDWLLEPVADANVYYRRTLGNGYQWGTLYLPFAVKVPAGVTAYYATQHSVGNTVISLTEVGSTIPAYTPVLIGRSVEDSKSRTDYDFTLTADVGAIVGNIFEGSILTSYIECQEYYRYYLLLNASKGEAFYWIKHEYNEYGGSGDTHIKCDANKAYLSVDTSSVSPSSYYRFEFEDGSTTGIEEVESENGEAKTIYDLQGRRLTEITEPGVYIIDGNKVLVK